MSEFNVIVVSDYGYVNGGSAQVAISGLNYIADEGFNVLFIAGSGPIDERINRDKIEVIDLGLYDLISNPSTTEAAINGIWNNSLQKKFKSILRNYDKSKTILHFHSWVNSLSASIIYLALKYGYKVVITLHDYFLVCPNGGFFNFVKNEKCSLKPLSIQCALTNCDRRNYIHKIWRFIRHATQYYVAGVPNSIKNFILVSDYSENILKKYLPNYAKIFKIHNPIDVYHLPPPDIKNNFYFTFVGRLSQEKGVRLLAKAAKNAGVKVVFVGEGDEHKKILIDNPDSLLVGWKSRDEVFSYIRSSRAIVFPSVWHETQGLTVMEAAALGVPAIVSNGCAARDYIIDGVTGLLFKCGDVNDLSKKLKILHDNHELAQIMGYNAYNSYWTGQYTLQMHVKKLVNCYRAILSESH